MSFIRYNVIGLNISHCISFSGYTPNFLFRIVVRSSDIASFCAIFWQLWPEKFQNKTNGVTPRRWIKFCNPYLSDIITKWTGTEDWVLHTEKLAELRKVILGQIRVFLYLSNYNMMVGSPNSTTDTGVDCIFSQ